MVLNASWGESAERAELVRPYTHILPLAPPYDAGCANRNREPSKDPYNHGLI
jgi:hypothetical protein